MSIPFIYEWQSILIHCALKIIRSKAEGVQREKKQNIKKK